MVAVEPGSAAEIAGLAPGDEVMSISGVVPTDVIAWQLLVDEADPTLAVLRGGHEVTVDVGKAAGVPLGAEVHAAIFDRVQTCDNHCEFCFIYQLPPGLRRSLYLKDDDYRLSFLYGNFTTLTRFTELDLERVLDERLSPLYVSIHATDPVVRARMLRNPRGATSLRWLSALLDGGVEMHGQVVVCPGVNDGAVLADTLLGVLDRFGSLETLAVVPLGVSSHQREPAMRPHTAAEAAAVVDLCEEWQQRFCDALGRRLVYAADEYYLLAGRPFPPAATYGDFPMHEDGIGMARAFEQEFMSAGTGGWSVPAASLLPSPPRPPAPAAGVSFVGGRAPAEGSETRPRSRHGANRSGEIDPGGLPLSLRATPVTLSSRSPQRRDRGHQDRPIGILTGTYGAAVLGPLVAAWRSETEAAIAPPSPDVRVIAVPNDFFGGNIGVTGLLAGADIAATLHSEPAGHRYLVADVSLSGGRFLDGVAPADLPHPVEIVPTSGAALRRLLTQRRVRAWARRRRASRAGRRGSTSMSADLPVVGIVGRPNVGKSTLFNRLVGRREAVVAPEPGVTRDRKAAGAAWRGHRFVVVDTGGWSAAGDVLDGKVSQQSERAMADADVLLLVVDVTVGITEPDARIAAMLRRSGRPTLVVANKSDSGSRDDGRWDFNRLGLGEAWAMSALHGRNVGDVLDRVLELLELDEADISRSLPGSDEVGSDAAGSPCGRGGAASSVGGAGSRRRRSGLPPGPSWGRPNVRQVDAVQPAHPA